MALSGMTGFARVSGEADWGSWTWEARSVNGKGLDARLNMPSGLEAVEQQVRKAVSNQFQRGNLQVSLRIELTGAETVAVNESVLQTLIKAYEAADGTMATGPALATLMGIKGVVEAETLSMRDLAEVEGAFDQLITSGREVIVDLHKARAQEGQDLTQMLFGHLSEMVDLLMKASEFAEDQKAAIAEKYRARIVEFDTENMVSDERLVTEIAVLAAKADVTEELDRLKAHIARGKDLIAADGAVGRDLGFLAQELNREANTLCSKSASLDLTNAGLALKSVIDQFKEQAANVE
ncbi:MAG: YicC family protein [Hyphomonadaceae bacterium]|nr:YicC family protein [Hyphomonadaceae bacterium]